MSARGGGRVSLEKAGNARMWMIFTTSAPGGRAPPCAAGFNTRHRARCGR